LSCHQQKRGGRQEFAEDRGKGKIEKKERGKEKWGSRILTGSGWS
jgi:hypothetical protein